MAVDDSWGTYKEPCKCGGTIEYWSFGLDSRGNGSSSGIQCLRCKKKYRWQDMDGKEKIVER